MSLAAAAALVAVASAVPAVAQVPADPPATGFLSRADVSFEWAHRQTPDRRFEWVGLAAVDLDVVDYRAGRVRFQAGIESGLGRERRRYDLNHGNYRFDAAASRRLTPEIEVEAFTQHVSRHLVDRQQLPAVSWNTFGLRGRYTSEDAEGALEWSTVAQPAFVDYRWIGRAHATYVEPLGAHWSAFGRADGEVIGVDRALRGASRVCGLRLEGGVRIDGRAAALDLFAAYERRVDAFPTDRFRVRWVELGFRIGSK